MNATLRGSRIRPSDHIRVVHTRTCARGGIDLVAVERAVNGERLPLTRAERIHAARLLDARGMGPVEISRRLGITHPTVLAWKAGKWQ